MRIPISLIVDDGAPVNPAYWLHPEQRNVFLVPNDFTADFAAFCVEHGVRGKFSVLPMPSGLGPIDQRLNYVPQRHLAGFLDLMQRRIAPLFDITPELLTHQMTVNLKTGGLLHLYEDEWVARASVEEITDYIAHALRILKNVGLPANGVTSPWSTGRHNERVYAEAIGRAQWRVHRRKRTWYFLHTKASGPPQRPAVTWRDRKTGQQVASVFALTGDPFWNTQHQSSRRAALDVALKGVDALLSPDGRSGRVRELFDAGGPIVLLTHWQSLFSNDVRAGLAGFKELVRRIEAVFGDQVEWVTCSKLARQDGSAREEA
ncbi:MAG: hypothetical protein FJ279_08765 [Planctomycetes bacterium]|nr:hypothetical protein [Planctomycetota bacterium]